MIDPRGIVVLDGGGSIVQHSQQVLLHVADLRCILLEAVEHKLDMLPFQLQQPGFDHRLGKIVPGHTDGFPSGADGLHHQLHHLVQLTGIPGVVMQIGVDVSFFPV